MSPDSPILPDDPRLTAFALGELEGAEQDAVARAVAADAALQQAVEQIRADTNALRSQLHAAQGEQMEFSVLLEAQVLARLNKEAATSITEDSPAQGLDDALATRALDKADTAARTKADASRRAPVDWRQGLGRDARRRVVWWSPFALPLAACFVAVGTVSLLWWNGYRELGKAEFSSADSFAESAAVPSLRMAAFSSETTFAHSADALAEQQAEALPARADFARTAPAAVGESVALSKSPSFVPAPSFEPASPVAPVALVSASGELSVGHAADVHTPATSVGLSARNDLFAPRVWAHRRSGGDARDSALLASSALPATGEAFSTPSKAPSTPNEEFRELNERFSATNEGHRAARFAQLRGTMTASGTVASEGDFAQSARPTVSVQSATTTSALPDAESTMQPPTAGTAAGVESAAQATAVASRSSEAPQTLSSQVLAEAVALVRPVAGALASAGSEVSAQGADLFSNAPPRTASVASSSAQGGGESASAPVATSSAVSPASTYSAPAPSVPTSFVSASSASGSGASGVAAVDRAAVSGSGASGAAGPSVAAVDRSSPLANGVPVAVAARNAAQAVELEGDLGEAAAADAASLSAADIATLAAAKRFSRASLEDLESAAFARDGDWRAGSEDITAAAASLAQAAVGTEEASALSQAAPAVSLRRQNLASRYVQLKLWVEAGQLPPQSDVDVEAIVRDAALAYMPGAVRRVRIQVAAASGQSAPAVGMASSRQGGDHASAAAASQNGSAPTTATAGTMGADGRSQITAQELEMLEAQSQLLRSVRSYAVVIKDRPADAVMQLDVIGEQIKKQPRLANSRSGQDFLKLLEATRSIL